MMPSCCKILIRQYFNVDGVGDIEDEDSAQTEYCTTFHCPSMYRRDIISHFSYIYKGKNAMLIILLVFSMLMVVMLVMLVLSMLMVVMLVISLIPKKCSRCSSHTALLCHLRNEKSSISFVQLQIIAPLNITHLDESLVLGGLQAHLVHLVSK